jgi:glycosyltransferase involved in cell wall biosynthesis
MPRSISDRTGAAARVNGQARGSGPPGTAVPVSIPAQPDGTTGRPGSRPAPGDHRQGSRSQEFRAVGDGLAITPTVTVVIPAMNEAANLPRVFDSLPGWIDEVILVDGRSRDDTIAVARKLRPDVKVVMQGGLGKGDALLAGFAEATGDIIVTLDADCSADGAEIVSFVSALVGGADFAKGSRFASAGRSDDITALRRYGNRALNLAVNAFFGTHYTDLCYGFNAFWSRYLPELGLDCAGFEVETQMSIKAAKAHLRVHEVPSHERPRMHGSSNLIAFKDGYRVLALIVQEKVTGRRRRGPRPYLAPGKIAVPDPAR